MLHALSKLKPPRFRRGSAKILDGKLLSHEIISSLKSQVKTLSGNQKPGLAVLMVGGRADSMQYVTRKCRVAAEIGFSSTLVTVPANSSVESIVAQIEVWNTASDIHGVLVQLPLPAHLDAARVLGSINISKDVDGFHPYNVGCLALRKPGMFEPWEATSPSNQKCATSAEIEPAGPHWGNIPCTPKACIALLDRYNIPIAGSTVVILGRSNIVGMPATLLFMHRHATVINVCRRSEASIPSLCAQADILVVAIGCANYVKGEWLKPGCVVIDVGINFVDSPDAASQAQLERQPPATAPASTRQLSAPPSSPSSSGTPSLPSPAASARLPSSLLPTSSRPNRMTIVGDVDARSVADVASWLTPVPGGVGPVTVAMLMQNTWLNFCRATGHRAL